MVWGKAAASGVDDLVAKLRSNDPKLQSLHIMRFRKLGHEEMVALCTALRANTVLTELDTSSHPLSAETAEQVAEMLKHNSTLRLLNVGNSSMSDDVLEALLPGLMANSSLRTLDLEKKALSVKGMASLQSYLASSGAASLARLNLASNSLGDEGVAALAGAWAGLQQLDLSQCGVQQQGVAALAAAEGLKGLQALSLADNHLGPACAQQLGSLVAAGSSLTSLDLQSTAVGDAGAAAVASSLQAAAALRCLDLSGCGITDAGAAQLGTALAGAKLQLQRLALSGNSGVGNAGSQALAAAGVQELDLAGCQVSASGLQALASASGLLRLNLFSCPVGDDGAAELAAAFRSGGFSTLHTLSASGCKVSEAGMAALVGALLETKPGALQVLEVGGNPGVSPDGQWPELLAAVREALPALDVHWRAADPGQQQQQ